ncbi:MAG: HU family DNA-binding protein [Chloroflexaceae bacterium]|nr:HU family DNA-binding protein [Chloroflexaceae bacterium]
MQKTEFIKAVTDRIEKESDQKIAQKDVRIVIEMALKVIADTLAQGEKVTLTGFGTFEVRDRQEREGVNPQTREKITIPATKTPGFSASSTLKEQVKGGVGSNQG